MLHKIKELLDEIEKSEQRAAQLIADIDIAYEQLFMNARASTVAGLKKPNFYSFILQLRAQRDVISKLKFDIDLAIERDENHGKLGKLEKKGDDNGRI